MVPMQEKKGGLRHMMHLLGLNSFQYFLGLNIADFIICLFPVTLASLILLGFGDKSNFNGRHLLDENHYFG